MYELWAKKRKIDGKGQRYEYITSFEDEMQKFYYMDLLDREVYQEAMIIKNEECTMYRELEKPLVRNLHKR